MESMDKIIFNLRKVSIKDFLDCCLTCKYGERYYRSIKCKDNQMRGVLFADIDTVCDAFERKGLTAKLI